MKSFSIASRLLCGVCALGLTSAEASAQSTSVPQASEDSRFNGDIVVTARKTAERVQTVPVSITALTGDAIRSKGIAQIADVQLQTPSLSVTAAVQSALGIVVTLRGLTQQNFRLSVDSTIGLYQDGVYLPHGFGGSVGEFVDLDRIEVLRGPQGTLYGRSTTGGAVAIYSKTATPEKLEGFVRARAGTHKAFGAQAGINVPLSSTAAIRIAGEHHERGPLGVNIFNGKPLGRTIGSSVRASLFGEPTDWLKLTLRGDYAQEHMNANASRGGLIGTFGPPGTALPFGGTVAASGTNEIGRALGLTAPFSAADLARIAAVYASAPANIDDGNMDVHPDERGKIAGASLTADFSIGEATLRSITGYRYYLREGDIDLDSSPFTMISYQRLRTQDEQLSQEFTLTNTAFSDRLKYVIGTFFSRESGTDYYDTRTFGLLTNNGFNVQDGDVVNTSLGAYLQASYSVTDALRVTGGLRWSHDRRELTTRNRSGTACTALGVPLTPGLVCSQYYNVSFSQLSYTIGLDYKITPDVMVFAKHDRGYRSGGVPYDGGSAQSPSSAATTYATFRPEIVMNYEAGVKADLLARRLRLNLSYFHNDFSNIQNTVSQPRPDGVPGQITRVGNAAAAKIDGVEGEARIVPSQNFELAGHFSYINSRYTSFLTGPVGVATTQNFTGYPLNLAPKWAYGVSASVSQPVGAAEVRANLDYSWEDMALSNNSPAYREAHGILNGRVTLDLAQQGLEVSLYGKNLTNKRYLVQPSGGYSSLGFVFSGPLNNPRELGIEIGAKF